MFERIRKYLSKRKLRHQWHRGNTFTYAKGKSVRPSFRCSKELWDTFKQKHENPSERLKELITQDINS